MIEYKDKKCPFCDHVFPFDFIICPNCGKKYNKYYEDKKCPYCEHVFPLDFIICPNCGKKYNKKN